MEKYDQDRSKIEKETEERKDTHVDKEEGGKGGSEKDGACPNCTMRSTDLYLTILVAI